MTRLAVLLGWFFVATQVNGNMRLDPNLGIPRTIGPFASQASCIAAEKELNPQYFASAAQVLGDKPIQLHMFLADDYLIGQPCFKGKL